eukprot:TRINITY_DN4886_c0_g1_i1.p1 TRINITY_DN4886_c0_g1~~TRINITY_DN4886_c0_g1_i1.p1  ORF type:complete len:369 (+),score=71.30 TRINITY_DN4886_c0_g1_i1:84-1190(+)
MSSSSTSEQPPTATELQTQHEVSVPKVLSNEEIVDKIKGVIFGQAIGDALGLSTEFMSKNEAVAHYGVKRPITYDRIRQDHHRRRWLKGDWTDDTDQMILILNSFIELNEVDHIDFAKKLKFWVKSGFPEFGDLAGMGLGQTVGTVVHNPLFESIPHDVAVRAWESMKRNAAANGGVMRTSILGVIDYTNIDKVISNTLRICKTTHADPRCLASCIAVTTLIAYVLQGKEVNNELLDKCLNYARQQLENFPEHVDDFEKYSSVLSFDELKLDEEPFIGYTLKCYGSGWFCFKQIMNDKSEHTASEKFENHLQSLILEGGDSDTNGAVAGALMGVLVGYKNLPEHLLNGLVQKDWLNEKVEKLLKLLGF